MASNFRRAAPKKLTRETLSTNENHGTSGVNTSSSASTVSSITTATTSGFSRLAGTKPFVNGQTLVSSGNSDLDALVGGGFLLGTLVLVDASGASNSSSSAAAASGSAAAAGGGGGSSGGGAWFSIPEACASFDFVDILHRYFIAQGVVSSQQTLVVGEEPEQFIDQRLPLELSLAQKQIKQQMTADQQHQHQHQHQQPQQPHESSSATSLKSPVAAPSPVASNDLKIAWQYNKYLTTGTSPTTAVTTPLGSPLSPNANALHRFCHSFDLSKRMQLDVLSANRPSCIDIHSSDSRETKDHGLNRDAFQSLLQQMEQSVLQAKQDHRVCRISIQQLPLDPAKDPRALFSSVFQLVRAMRSLLARVPGHAICMVSLPLDQFPAVLGNELRHLCHYVLELKAFAGEKDLLPDEMNDFDGLCTFRKLARLHTLAAHAIDATTFGIKRKRRKLKIEKLHLPPEASRSTKSSSSCGSSIVTAASSSGCCAGSSTDTSCCSGSSSGSTPKFKKAVSSLTLDPLSF